jgi:hypothetical protein
VPGDTQTINGTLTVRAGDRSTRELPVGVADEHASLLCVPASPGNRTLRAPRPRQLEHRGPRSKSSALKIVPTRVMMWTGSVRPSIAVITNMAKKPLLRGGSQGILVVWRNARGGVVHSVLQ